MYDRHLTTVLLAGFGTNRLRREQPMKTAGRENPNRWVTVPGTRVHGAAIQNGSRSIQWAGKQENFRSGWRCFFLTSPFIELRKGPLKKALSRRRLTQSVLTIEVWHHPPSEPFIIDHSTLNRTVV